MGNSDMHLKNFSLIKRENGYELAPAYDVIASKIFLPKDREELALHLNRKKNRISKKDFISAMRTSKLPDKSIRNLFDRIEEGISLWENIINNSFLNTQNQNKLIDIIKANSAKIYGC